MIFRLRKMAHYFPRDTPNPKIWQEIWIIIQEKGKIFGFGFLRQKIDIQLFLLPLRLEKCDFLCLNASLTAC